MALLVGDNDPGFVHNGPLAGLVAVCAGSDVMHPLGALVTGGVAGALFVWAFTLTQNRLKIDETIWQQAFEKMIPAKALAVNRAAFEFGRSL